MGVTAASVLIYGGAMAALFLGGRLLRVPMNLIGKLLINAFLGGICLVIVNFFGKIAGFTVGINPITALIAGTLGVPGVILLIILQLIIA